MAKVMYQGKEVEAIDCTPTWEGMLRYYIAVLQDGTREGQKIATEELTNMAKAADKWVAYVKEHNAKVDEQNASPKKKSKDVTLAAQKIHSTIELLLSVGTDEDDDTIVELRSAYELLK